MFNPLLQGLVLILHAGVVSSEFIQLLRQLQVMLVDPFKVPLFLLKFPHLPFEPLDPLFLSLNHDPLFRHQF